MVEQVKTHGDKESRKKLLVASLTRSWRRSCRSQVGARKPVGASVTKTAAGDVGAVLMSAGAKRELIDHAGEDQIGTATVIYERMLDTRILLRSTACCKSS